MIISIKNIASKNLNSLVIFKALFETENMTRASEKLGMSQPNLSRALKLLRSEFKDPLFVRVTRGLAPTPKAIEISRFVDEILSAVQAIYSPKTFNPSIATGRFTIYTTDYIEFLLAPELAAWISQEAPGITLSFRPSEGYLPKQQMEKGECDLNLLVVRENIPPNYIKQDLFVDPYLCAVRKQHPILRQKNNIQSFLEYGHTMITPQGLLWAITDERLLKLGKKRKLVLATPNALSNVFAITSSDLILTATRRFIERAAVHLPITTFKSPFEIAPIQVAQIWHERVHNDPINQWIRKKIKMLLPSVTD